MYTGYKNIWGEIIFLIKWKNRKKLYKYEYLTEFKDTTEML